MGPRSCLGKLQGGWVRMGKGNLSWQIPGWGGCNIGSRQITGSRRRQLLLQMGFQDARVLDLRIVLAKFGSFFEMLGGGFVIAGLVER